MPLAIIAKVGVWKIKSTMTSVSLRTEICTWIAKIKRVQVSLIIFGLSLLDQSAKLKNYMKNIDHVLNHTHGWNIGGTKRRLSAGGVVEQISGK